MKELVDVNECPEGNGVTKRSPNAQEGSTAFAARTRWQTLFAVPLAVAIALFLHWFAAKKEPPGENTFIQLLLDWPARNGHRCSDPSTSLVRTARVDADSLPSRRGRRFVPDRMGIDDCRLSLVSFALLPEPCGRVAESSE